MFGMLPFERQNDNLFDLFDNFERKFFGNTSANLPAFRTDIRDMGDKFLLEAELPGFNKEDISLDLKDGILTIKAEHKENKDEKDDKPTWVSLLGLEGARTRARELHDRANAALALVSADPAVPEGAVDRLAQIADYVIARSH